MPQRKAGAPTESSANVWISVSLTEGKNREVRRVLESIGLKVNRLVRLACGGSERLEIARPADPGRRRPQRGFSPDRRSRAASGRVARAL